MTERATIHRLAFLDGMRGAAALWVTIGHAFGLAFDSVPWPWSILFNWIIYPHFAVGVFIVLSGYCLMLPTLPTKSLKTGIAAFYARRAWRILPPLYVSLAIAFLFAIVVDRFGRTEAHFTLRQFWIHLLLLQDVFVHENSILFVTWSVALEFKIYLVFPLILLIVRRHGWAAALFATCMFGYGTFYAAKAIWPSLDLSFACPWYLLLFTMGAAAADASPFSKRLLPLIAMLGSIAGVIALACFFPRTTDDQANQFRMFPLQDFLVGVAASIALVMMKQPGRSVLRRSFESKWLVAVGVVSFSLYLIHIPCLHAGRLVAIHLLHAPTDPTVRLTLSLCVGFPLVIIGTVVMFYCVEMPFLRKRTKQLKATT